MNGNARPERHIALLIDADNSPAAKIEVILAELAKLGVTNIRRAYGNWKKNELKGWEKVLHEFAIRPIQQFDVSKGKNATDMLIAIDALDLLYTDRPDAFGIVSSDADFTPLVMHLRAKGATVYGFGAKKTPAPFVAACSRFLYLESLGEGSAAADEAGATEAGTGKVGKAKSAAPRRPSAAELKRDARLVSLLRNAVENAAGEDGWSQLGAVGSQIANQASFDPRNHGFKKLGDLIEAIGLFDVEKRGTHLYVRDRRAGQGDGRGD
ncbi:MAG: NYN domain-containing protein [Rubrivivax sp.]|nr:NYN domain-containing protein [Rubrivivax sp.]